MRPSHADPEVESYLQKAERDIATAIRMSEAGPDFADIVCFHAEQCAEKSMKGLLLAFGVAPPRTHDLVVLQRAALKLDKRTGDLEPSCLLLSDYAVAPRYPGWEDLVGTVDVKSVLDAAKGVLDRVLVCLNLS